MTATAAKIPPAVIATATADSTQLANAQKFAPELAVIQANPALFTKLQADPTNTTLQAQAIAAAGGGAKGARHARPRSPPTRPPSTASSRSARSCRRSPRTRPT